VSYSQAIPVQTPAEIRAAETVVARRVKRRNAVTATLTGAALAFAAVKWYGARFSPLAFAGGFLAGLLYANAFEYVLHRFVLHWGESFLVQSHGLHHDTAGAPNEARYVNFATSPLVVILLFLLNAPAAFAVESALHRSLAPGMLAGFTIYYVLYEEIHWRFHMGGWLPRWMAAARRHHMLHHGGFEGRYNVFLPLCDWIFNRHDWRRQPLQPR
jgi:hypothetical protein